MSTLSRQAVRDALITRGAVAVIRLDDASSGLALADALSAGGVTAIEVTLTTPNAALLIAALREHAPSLLIGAGTVLSVADAREVIAAGAQFVVSPVFDAQVVSTVQSADIVICPGAYTPTEMLHAHRAGADLVKVFPAESLGPAFLKGVLAPMPFLSLMPTGGVTPQNVGAWMSAGAAAVGLGSTLVDAALVRAGRLDEITARAQTVSNGIEAARATLRRNS